MEDTVRKPGTPASDLLSALDWPDLLDRMHDGFLLARMVSENGRPVDFQYVYANPSGLRLTGCDASQVIGKLSGDCLPDADKDWQRDMLRVGKERKAATFDRRQGFGSRCYDVHAFPVGQDMLGILFTDVTDREHGRAMLEKRANELERRLTATVSAKARTWEVTPDLLSVFDMDGNFEQANPAWEKTLARAPDELKGTRLFDLVHPDDIVRTLGALESIRADNPVLRFENRYRHADGSWRWLSWVAVPEGDRIYCSARDITEDKAQAAALADRDLLWNASRDLWVVITLDGAYRQVNPAWTAELGHPADTLKGMRFDVLAHPDDLAGAHAAFEAVLRGERVNEFEARMRTADGAYRAFEWNAELRGDVVFALGRDISDRKAREAELAERTAERDRVWRASPDLYVTIGTDGRLRALNPAWTSELGYRTEDLVGMPFDALTHPEDRACTERKRAEARSGVTVTDHEIRLKTNDGAFRWYGFTLFLDGDLLVAYGRNIDERRARQAELAEAEEHLRQSQKMEMIGQLTGGVAHDFNNLLMAVRSGVELALKRLETDAASARTLLENARHGVERGTILTQRMLAFARKQDLIAAPVDVTELIEGMRDLLERSLGPGIRVVTNFQKQVPCAIIDSNQLELAVINLAVNGRDAMRGEGELTLSVSLTTVASGQSPPPGRYVRLEVADTGDGMDADTLARAAEPFFTTKGVGQGTGLGVSMVHGLAEQSGGVFRLTSGPGTGTQAELLLPVAEAVDAGSTPGTGNLDPAAASRRLTILAVDDDSLVLMGTAGMLEDLGHTVIEAHSGSAALTLLAAHPEIDLVMTDQSMPKMTGIQMAEQARALRPTLPIVLATGYAEIPENGERFITSRLSKPFGLRTLERTLMAAIGAHVS